MTFKKSLILKCDDSGGGGDGAPVCFSLVNC